MPTLGLAPRQAHERWSLRVRSWPNRPGACSVARVRHGTPGRRIVPRWSSRALLRSSSRPIALSPYRPFRPHFPPRLRLDPDLSCLQSKAATMVDRKTGLRLPLMHHLVQNRVLDFRPRVAQDMTPADGDLGGPTGAEVYRQLSEPGAHPAGDPDRDGAEAAAEMLPVQPLMAGREALQQGDVARAGRSPRAGRGGGGAYSSTGKPRNSRSARRRMARGSRGFRNRTIARSTRSGALAYPWCRRSPPRAVSETMTVRLVWVCIAADITKAEEFETVREQIVHFRAPDRLPPPRPRPAARPGGRRSRRPR